MALLLKKLYHGYLMIDQIRDPRADSFFIMDNPFPMLAISLSYLFFSLNYGPKLMKNRKPFDLKHTIIGFNALQVVVNTYIFIEAFSCLVQFGRYCVEIDYGEDSLHMRAFTTGYLYFLTKILDLLDTIFFVLRKKDRQITFLHVYHHFWMVVGIWTGVKFWNGGSSMTLVAANSFVHAVMYSYYLLTAYDTHYQKSTWWKKHITQLQLMQFFFFIVYYGGFFFMPQCRYPKIVSFIFVPQNFFIFILFSDFYYKAYIKSKTQ